MLLDCLAGILVSPAETYRQLHQKPHYLGAAVVVLLAAALQLIEERPTALVPYSVTGFVSGLLWGMAVFGILAGVMHGSARFLAGSGSLGQTFQACALSLTPLLLQGPLLLVHTAVAGPLVRPAPLLLLAQLGLRLWAAALFLLGLRYTHGFSWLRTFAALAVPVVLVFLLLLAIWTGIAVLLPALF